ncbi:MAG: hypothetical protein IKZ87_01470 [Actinomycetaceae bacterium]|nr:hypothetical protein [Actinomycetaceae bacterium]
MSSFSSDVTHLLYKGLQRVSPVNDRDYRELLARYRDDGNFRNAVDEAALGQEQQVLECNQYGIFVAPRNRQSLYSLRLSDLRQKTFTGEQKVACALVLLCICAVFFPSTALLENESIENPRWKMPANISDFRNKIAELIEKTREEDAPPELAAGWSLLGRLADVTDNDVRASFSSREGLVRQVLKWMVDYGLVRPETDEHDDRLTVYYATNHLRYSLRSVAHPGLFKFVSELKTVEEH